MNSLQTGTGDLAPTFERRARRERRCYSSAARPHHDIAIERRCSERRRAPGAEPRALLAPMLNELHVHPSEDGQPLVIRWGDEALALYSGMGASPEHIVFADGVSRPVEDVLDLMAAKA